MKRSVVVAAHLALILFITSCGKSTCLNPGIHITFYGFDSVSLSRVLVTQYVRNSNFSNLVSISVYDTGYTQIHQSADTIYRARIDTSGLDIAPGYDYIIAVPAVASSFFADSAFKISKITYTDVKRRVSATGDGECTNNVSYALDSIPYKVTGESFTKANFPRINIVLNK